MSSELRSTSVSQRRRLPRAMGLIGATVATLTPVIARADAAPITQPSSSLEQLSRDTQHIYRSVRGSLIRVQLPTPDWLRSINEQRALLQKWGGQMTPQVRQLFVQQQQNLAAMLHDEPATSVAPATTASSATAPSATTQPVVTLPLPLDPRYVHNRLVLLATGLIIDAEGHALLPAFVDPATLNGHHLRVITGDGRMIAAALVGSDRLSNLSVLKLDPTALKLDPALTPASLSPARPADGSLVVTLGGDGAARLVIWNTNAPDPGVVAELDGTVAGFSANGRFLAATACRPIVEQILATGSVHRAVLGVRVREMSADDLLRRREVQQTFEPAVAWPADAGASAMQVVEVEPDSAAAHAGLQPGDLILTAAGQAVEDTATFSALIATRRGRTVLTVLRQQQVCQVTVDLLPPP